MSVSLNKRFEPIIVCEGHTIYNSNCLDVLKQLPSNSVQLVVTDPPYNIDLKYNTYKDNKKWTDYYDELGEVIKEIERILTNDGSFYLINYPEVNARTIPYFDKTKLIFKRWLTWHYPTNIGHSKNNYTRSQRSILFYTKSEENIFNKDAIVQPYKNPTVGKIKKRIEQGHKGRTPYDTLESSDLIEIFNENDPDVLNINLLKNVSKNRELNHPCQLPSALLKVFILASSNPNDTVLDCYAGTFSTCQLAKQLNRKSIGIEIDEKYFEIGVKRLADNDTI
ncbi:MAG: hypothetical protein HXX18_05895 [Bacteroidetes bacterium]|nr:hypothetical protein [Bacteroidota bacterium]